MDIHLEIDALLCNQQKLKQLLLLEKERRGVDKDELVFIGMADTANYYWCAMKSLFKNKEMEPDFFASYLQDRVLYSSELGLIDELPSEDEKLLRVGDSINFEDIENLLQQRKREKEESDITISSILFQDENGDKVLAISDLELSPFSSDDLREVKKIAISDDIKSEEITKMLKLYGGEKASEIEIVSLEEYPKYRGEILQDKRSEKYPTIRWNFEWGDYVVVGVPDGITDSFVYEFKTTRSEFSLYYAKPVAFTQADLYGYFFRRDMKRVQFYITGTGETKTWEKKVDKENAEKTLKSFKKTDKGGEEPIPPKEWKCKFCEFRKECPITPQKQDC
ncbi:MAG: hypothetical protein WHS82_03865 [Candidatus Methanosuratincola sp.]